MLVPRNCWQVMQLRDDRFSRKVEEWLSPEPEYSISSPAQVSWIKGPGQTSANLQKYSLRISLLSDSPGKQVSLPNGIGVNNNYI